ncbi:RNA polymerase-associated protein RTF1 homolog isoform X2 [Schistocerca gregaria]|uniref:RNA polymerase-associated protein RTF1 homolog isoform X2 n=1 Tax=Schistocerca gregaria TaxID=7010 RepID=UPI00211F19A3|nr:RNA polymerase-associated protein RTF1 homolog isoform X2 [Schistocerca gregaria]
MERYKNHALDEDYKPEFKKRKRGQWQRETDVVCDEEEEDSVEEGSDVVSSSLESVVDGSEISDDEQDSYDSDLYIDERDREELARLPESQREEVLFERSERRKQIRERNALKSKLRMQLQKERRGMTEASGYASTRHAREAERSGEKRQQDALSELKVLREKKMVKSGLSRGLTRQGSAPEGAEVEREVVGGCDVGGGRRDTRKDVAEKDAKEVEFVVRDETTYQDICRITIRRNTLLKWIGEPYWDRTVRGVLVRACVGQSASGGIYRLAEVVDYHEQENLKYVLDGKEYSMKLSLTIGDATRDFTLEYISNYLPSETEYQDWKRLVLNQKLLLPTKESMKRIYANIEAARNYVHTCEDVDRKVAENNAKLRREGRNLAVYSPILRKNTLLMLKCAQARQDHANIARLEAELRELDELRAAEQKRSVIATANAQVILSINQKNRGKNTAIRRSYVPESTVLETELNPFARRPTYSSVFIARQTKPLIETKENATGGNAEEEVLPEAASPTSPPQQPLEDDWRSSVDVDLKLDLDSQQLAPVNTLVASTSFSEEKPADSSPAAAKQSYGTAEEVLRVEAQIPAPRPVPGRVVSLTDYLRQKKQT